MCQVVHLFLPNTFYFFNSNLDFALSQTPWYAKVLQQHLLKH